jgi:hypothetical protein
MNKILVEISSCRLLKTVATDFSENVVDVVNSCENIQSHMAENGKFKKLSA